MVIYGGDDDGDNVGGDEVDDAYNGGEGVLATMQDCFIAAVVNIFMGVTMMVIMGLMLRLMMLIM